MNSDRGPGTLRGQGQADPTAADGEPVTSHRHSTLLRNFSVLMMSQVTTWTIALLGVAVIPRYLGAELIGRLHIATSLWALALVVVIFGVDMMITKEVARDPDRVGTLLGTGIAVRMLLLVPVTAVLFGYLWLGGYPGQTMVIAMIIGLATAINSITSSMSAALQGLERMGMLAVAGVSAKFVAVGGGVVLLVLGSDVYAVAAMVATGNLIAFVILFRALREVRRERGDDTGLRLDPRGGLSILRAGAPYFAVGFFIAMYLQIDAVVISLVVETDEVLGWYSVYDRLGGTLMFLPTVFITAAYPTFSRMYADDSDGASRLAQRCFESMLLLSVPVGFGLAAVADPVVELLFGEDFAEAGSVVAVGGFVTVLTYLTTVLGMLLISMDRQRLWTRFIALGAFLTIPLDIVLVPYFQEHYDNGAIGGAVAYLITEMIMLGGAIYLLPRGALGSRSVFFSIRVIAAGLLMFAAVVPFRDLVLPVPVAIGALVYAGAVFALRLISADDRRLVRGLLRGGPS